MDEKILKEYGLEKKTFSEKEYVCREITSILPPFENIISYLAIETLQDYEEALKYYSETEETILLSELNNLFDNFVQELSLEYPYLDFKLNFSNEDKKIFWGFEADGVKEEEKTKIFFLALESFLKPYFSPKLWANIFFKS